MIVFNSIKKNFGLDLVQKMCFVFSECFPVPERTLRFLDCLPRKVSHPRK